MNRVSSKCIGNTSINNDQSLFSNYPSDDSYLNGVIDGLLASVKETGETKYNVKPISSEKISYATTSSTKENFANDSTTSSNQTTSSFINPIETTSSNNKNEIDAREVINMTESVLTSEPVPMTESQGIPTTQRPIPTSPHEMKITTSAIETGDDNNMDNIVYYIILVIIAILVIMLVLNIVKKK